MLMWQSYAAADAVFSAEPWTVPWTAKTILQSQEMEYATKPPSNISDIVCKFAKVCRFRSIGVFSTENPTHNHQPIIDFGNNVPSSEDSSDATEEAECDIEKIHPNPVEIQPKTTECVNMEILKRYLDHNQFTGSIPDAFYKHTFLKEMYIEGNAFWPGVNPIGVHNVLEVSDIEFLF
ncbi:unnamed protein product [Camellia sinensis]